MNLITVFWAVLSIIPGTGFVIAGKSLWDVRKQPGSLFPLIFCLANGIYDIAFGVLILVAAVRGPGANSIDLVVIWVVLYIPARIASMGLALLLAGQISESWLRKALRL